MYGNDFSAAIVCLYQFAYVLAFPSKRDCNLPNGLNSRYTVSNQRILVNWLKLVEPWSLVKSGLRGRHFYGLWYVNLKRLVRLLLCLYTVLYYGILDFIHVRLYVFFTCLHSLSLRCKLFSARCIEVQHKKLKMFPRQTAWSL